MNFYRNSPICKKLSLVSLANYFLDIFDNFDEKKRRKMAKGQVRQGI